MNDKKPLQNILTGLAFFATTCCVAVAGYLIAGWGVSDAIYMVIITIFGVGYGEVRPIEDPTLRVFTIGVIIAGYAAAIYTVGGFVQFITEGEINRALGERRMLKELERLSGHIIMCGYGRMGKILARQLAEAEQPMVVIDNDPAAVEAAKQEGFLAILGSAADEHVLERAGVHRAATLVAVLSSEAQNVFITLTARDMNESLEIISRGDDPMTEKKLLRSGANRVVLPAAIGATRISHIINRPSAEEMLATSAMQGQLNDELTQIGLQFDELMVPPGSPMVGRPMTDIEIRSNQGFLIVALRRADGSTIVNPVPEIELREHDVLIVIGHTDDNALLSQRFVPSARQMTYRGQKVVH